MLSKFDRFVFWLHLRGCERIEIRGVPVYIPLRRGEQFRKTERQISMAIAVEDRRAHSSAQRC